MLESKEEIDKWLKENNIFDFIIHDNLIVDVEESVNLVGKKLDFLPCQFGKIIGNFVINGNHLNSFQGCPYEVTENFIAIQNKIKSFYDCPKIIGKNLFLDGNDFQEFNLSDLPVHVGELISFNSNNEMFKFLWKKKKIKRRKKIIFKDSNLVTINISQLRDILLNEHLENTLKDIPLSKKPKKLKKI